MKKLIGAIVVLLFLVVVVFLLDRLFQIETQIQDTTGFCYSNTNAVVTRVEMGEGSLGPGFPDRFCYESRARHPQA